MFVSVAAACLLFAPAIADDIVLLVNPGPATGESVQTWTGGSSPYQLHRSDQPSGIVAPAHLIGLATTGDPGITDAVVPAEGAVFFYLAVSGSCGDAVIDLDEACDDGGIAPGDGCSAVCQVETAASLTLSPSSQSFGNALVGTPSSAVQFQVGNQGDMTSGALSIGLVAGNTGDFAILAPVAGDCVPGASLAGHSSCVVRARFAPQSAGLKSATLRISATPGGSRQSTLSGTGKWPLTIDVDGTGAVTRDGVPACVGTCPETTGHDDEVDVTLVATPQNNSNFYFSAWSGACAGPQRTCTVTMTQARTVTATFSPMAHNLGFVSSSTVPPTLGSVTAYDAQCNSLATAAGLNNAGGNAYIAWISLPFMSAQARLGVSAQGWVRVDGRPFATTQASLLNSGVVYHSLRLDEYGVDVGTRLVMTGTSNDGQAQSNCFNWTSNSATVFMTGGDAAFGSGGWSGPATSPCSVPASIYCLMKTKTAALTVTPEAGKRIYLSGNYTPALGTPPDQRCTLDKPIGLGTVKALVATTSTTAAAILNSAQRYVRMDGVFIGTGADLAAGGKLTSGMWQTGAGAYAGDAQLAWTGAPTPTDIGTSASTCSNWTSTATTARVGRVASTDTNWWSLSSQSCSATTTRLYCVEQ